MKFYTDGQCEVRLHSTASGMVNLCQKNNLLWDNVTEGSGRRKKLDEHLSISNGVCSKSGIIQLLHLIFISLFYAYLWPQPRLPLCSLLWVALWIESAWCSNKVQTWGVIPWQRYRMGTLSLSGPWSRHKSFFREFFSWERRKNKYYNHNNIKMRCRHLCAC